MTIAGKQRKVKELLRKNKAVLLVHYYQREEIQDIADYLGDSLGLSIEAAKTEAAVIVFAGVKFMAESAAILSPEKTVLLPRLEAGCPLADTITIGELDDMKKNHPGAAVVTYVNSTAEIKAASDICCTSANVDRVIRSIDRDAPIIMAPDGNLADYAARITGRNIIAWKGYCPVHHFLDPDDVQELKDRYPEAVFAAHPECRRVVLDLADYVGSTGGILKYVRTVDAEIVIVGTEMGIIHQLAKQNPGKTFVPASPSMICETMKYTTLDDIVVSLEEMRNVITVPEEMGAPARRALDRMLAVS
ncbi:MAG: quinolinate synthase NadA [Deltaproteobacteria bacterium]|nr:quinolinate synthase NadA [Deltaproteobacteria bacterium]